MSTHVLDYIYYISKLKDIPEYLKDSLEERFDDNITAEYVKSCFLAFYDIFTKLNDPFVKDQMTELWKLDRYINDDQKYYDVILYN